MNNTSNQSEQSKKYYDGIICFGGVDWWYHNRGHYDLQMMREFSNEVPVLYVNSIGMRMPKPGRGSMFIKRIARKLKSLRRGLVKVKSNFSVFSPVSIPGNSGREITRQLLPLQVRNAASKMGITNPLVWVACPPAVDVVENLNPVGVIYQRTDRFEAFSGIDTELIKSFDTRLKQMADLTLYCSTKLYEEESSQCRASLFADHGVDYDYFSEAGKQDESNDPADIKHIGRPRIGFVGGIDAHTFDPDLFFEVAASRPEYQYVLVGACSLPDDWCPLENVHQLGQRQYTEVAEYMAACDVLIMPWNNSEWIKACNPVKLKEYLAVGRPVVSTPFYELNRYSDYVHTAKDTKSFIHAVDKALAEPGEETARRNRIKDETWSAKAQLVNKRLQSVGIMPSTGCLTETREQMTNTTAQVGTHSVMEAYQS